MPGLGSRNLTVEDWVFGGFTFSNAPKLSAFLLFVVLRIWFFLSI